jgi:HlyD family secretion protein
MSRETLPAHRSIRWHLIAGVSALALLAGAIGGWAATTQLSSAVIAPGTLVVESNVKKVQHLTGGIVGELHVHDGDRVKGGDLLIRLDDTQMRANLEIITKSLDELGARQVRFEAERDDAEAVVFPEDLLLRKDEPALARVITGEKRLFELRRNARDGQKAQLRERIGQLREEIEGLSGQADAKHREIELITKELEGTRTLWRQKLIPFSRLVELERGAARLEGERGQLIATIAQTKGKISETELQILQIDQDLRTEVGKELAEIRAKTTELAERKVAAQDLLKRVDINAPQTGKVHQLAIHTIGGVVTPGETLMLIVPEGDALKIEAHISPNDIDQIRQDQKVVLRFSSFNQRSTPEVVGSVNVISADVSQDQKTGAAYYTVRIDLPVQEIARLHGLKLVPGMPVESFIQTGERTALSYFVKPLTDQFARTFREN